MSIVTVKLKNLIGNNLLSIAAQMDWTRWSKFLSSPTLRQYAKDLNLKFIRMFDWRTVKPCTHWDSATHTGTWNWANTDNMVNAIYDIGVEPLFCFGWATISTATSYYPSGMVIDPTTNLPAPDDYAAYCSEWVRHFKQTGKPVRFYEIFNEPYGYLTWNISSNLARAGYFKDVWNATAAAMRQVNPNIMISFDFSCQWGVLNYWCTNGGAELDYLDFHKYDDGTVPGRTDENDFLRAEQQNYTSTPFGWTLQQAADYYYQKRGRRLPIFCSESNMNSAWETGTDPRIQQMSGAVWWGLTLRMAILNGLSYYVVFELTSNKAWELANKPSGGWGFGMIDEVNMVRWLPYYTNLMYFANLSVGDSIIETATADPDLRVIGWIHQDKLNLLLIHKSHTSKTVSIQGDITGNVNYTKIDESTDVNNPNPATGTYAINAIPLNGYTVMLLQTPVPTPPLDLPTIGGIILGITDAALITYGIAHFVGLV